jgi:DNA-binding XRE family transcriptional regulator
MEAHKSPKIEAPADKPREERSETARAANGERGSDARKPEASNDQKVEAAEKKEERPAAGKSVARGKKAKNNVRKLRMERMMSKAELARRAGISTLTVDRVERGMPCRMDTKRKILEALGLKPSDRVMVFGDPPDEPGDTED